MGAERLWLAPKLPPEQLNVPRGEIFKMLLTSFFPLALLVGAVLGSILFGVATPTEAAAVGALGAALLAQTAQTIDLQRIRDFAQGARLRGADGDQHQLLPQPLRVDAVLEHARARGAEGAGLARPAQGAAGAGGRLGAVLLAAATFDQVRTKVTRLYPVVYPVGYSLYPVW